MYISADTLLFWLMRRMVWPEAKIFLCLWHVRKAWAENAVKKISCAAEHATVLQKLGDIMYGTGCSVYDNPIDWTIHRLDNISNTRPLANAFMNYINELWRAKIPMWCVGARRIPHAGQNTNAAIESYHSNLKSVLNSAKERFVGRRMDWLIYHLTGDVLTHYWYSVQCKAYGFICNKKQEGIVASAIMGANDIPASNVLICMDADVAYVMSVNNRPKIWTIKCPDSEWAQCDCPVAKEGMICKHTVKVFKMLHPGFVDGAIVREAGTRHGTLRGTPIATCYAGLSQQSTEIYVPDDVAAPLQVQPVVEDNVLQLDIDEEHTTLGPLHVDSENPSQFDSQFSQMDSFNEMPLSQESSSHAPLPATAHNIYSTLAMKAEQHPVLQNHLIAGLRHIRGKQDQLIAQGVTQMPMTPTTTLFPAITGDNSLKRRRSFLESTPSTKRKLSSSKGVAVGRSLF